MLLASRRRWTTDLSPYSLSSHYPPVLLLCPVLLFVYLLLLLLHPQLSSSPIDFNTTSTPPIHSA